MNYRTVIVYGAASGGHRSRRAAPVFDTITDHVAAGRAPTPALPHDDELRQTPFVKIPLDEASRR